MHTKEKCSVKQLAVAGVMAALVFVMTYLPKVPVPITGGYIHLGDGMIFLGAMLLGPVGIASAAVGSALSDLVGGLYPDDFPHQGTDGPGGVETL